MKKLTLIGLLATVAAFCSCERRPLNDPSEFVQILVEVNVTAVANVRVNVYNEHIPVPDLTTDMMRVLVYDTQTKNLLSQSFLSAKTINEAGNQVLSGALNISYGNYDILVYNFDTPTTQVNGESNEESITAFTTELPPALKNSYLGRTKAVDDDYQIRYEPDHLVVAAEHNLRISPHDTLVVIQTEATSVVDSYYLQIHVEGMQYASSATAVITGLSPANHFGLGIRETNPPVGVAFDLLKSTDENIPGENKDVLCAVFNTFGKIPGSDSELTVTFNVIDIAGNLQKFETSLNRIFLTEDAIERHWLLIDETWVIENPDPDGPSEGGGGFQPTVDDWEEEQGEIVL